MINVILAQTINNTNDVISGIQLAIKSFEQGSINFGIAVCISILVYLLRVFLIPHISKPKILLVTSGLGMLAAVAQSLTTLPDGASVWEYVLAIGMNGVINGGLAVGFWSAILKATTQKVHKKGADKIAKAKKG